MQIKGVRLVILNHDVSKCAEAESEQLPEEVKPWIAFTSYHKHVNVTSSRCGLRVLWCQPDGAFRTLYVYCLFVSIS